MGAQADAVLPVVHRKRSVPQCTGAHRYSQGDEWRKATQTCLRFGAWINSSSLGIDEEVLAQEA
jgi:hypothetical protein